MDEQALVTSLKVQHRSLERDLEELARLVSGEGAALDIVGRLSGFRSDLSAHLTLEDGMFYPSYKEKIAGHGMDIAGVEEFIRQMGLIAADVTAFLDEYATPQAVDASREAFAMKLRTITETLADRIETEEEGVYDVYLSM